MRYLKTDEKIQKGDKYFDGSEWIDAPDWMIGRYVNKKSAKEKRYKRGVK